MNSFEAACIFISPRVYQTPVEILSQRLKFGGNGVILNRDICQHQKANWSISLLLYVMYWEKWCHLSIRTAFLSSGGREAVISCSYRPHCNFYNGQAWEAGVWSHHGGLITVPPESHYTARHYSCEGFNEGAHLSPLYGERRPPLRRSMRAVQCMLHALHAPSSYCFIAVAIVQPFPVKAILFISQRICGVICYWSNTFLISYLWSNFQLK